jgi:hypothetical protein
MTTFEYIAVLVSIIVGLGITHLLAGVGRLIGDSEKTTPYWIHLVWTFYAFLYLVFFWWWEFEFNSLEVWTFELYMFILIYAVVIYMITVILYPRDLPEHGDFKRYYYDRRGWFFGLMIVMNVVDFVDTAAKGGAYLADLGTEYWAYLIVSTVIYVVAMRSTNERLHGILAVATTLYMLSWALRLYGITA